MLLLLRLHLSSSKQTVFKTISTTDFDWLVLRRIAELLQYATAVRELARRLGLPVVDLWSRKVTGHVASHWAKDRLLAADGVSLTAAGHVVCAIHKPTV
eukprot:SAG31_NODE_600_length_13647_cov_3.894376_5_plen_99_part_00